MKLQRINTNMYGVAGFAPPPGFAPQGAPRKSSPSFFATYVF